MVTVDAQPNLLHTRPSTNKKSLALVPTPVVYAGLTFKAPCLPKGFSLPSRPSAYMHKHLLHRETCMNNNKTKGVGTTSGKALCTLALAPLLPTPTLEPNKHDALSNPTKTRCVRIALGAPPSLCKLCKVQGRHASVVCYCARHHGCCLHRRAYALLGASLVHFFSVRIKTTRRSASRTCCATSMHL